MFSCSTLRLFRSVCLSVCLSEAYIMTLSCAKGRLGPSWQCQCGAKTGVLHESPARVPLTTPARPSPCQPCNVCELGLEGRIKTFGPGFRRQHLEGGRDCCCCGCAGRATSSSFIGRLDRKLCVSLCEVGFFRGAVVCIPRPSFTNRFCDCCAGGTGRGARSGSRRPSFIGRARIPSWHCASHS